MGLFFLSFILSPAAALSATLIRDCWLSWLHLLTLLAVSTPAPSGAQPSRLASIWAAEWSAAFTLC